MEDEVIVFGVLTVMTGGRYTPFTEAYKPQVFMRTADVTCRMKWPEGTADPESKMVSIMALASQ